MLREFRAFVNQGNAIDLAVGVMIGAAFAKIVDSLINDIVTPVVGLLTGGLDFRDRFFALNGQHYDTLAMAKEAGAAVLAYGSFINAVFNFLVVAFTIFLVVRQMNRIRGTKT